MILYHAPNYKLWLKLKPIKNENPNTWQKLPLGFSFLIFFGALVCTKVIAVCSKPLLVDFLQFAVLLQLA